MWWKVISFMYNQLITDFQLRIPGIFTALPTIMLITRRGQVDAEHKPP